MNIAPSNTAPLTGGASRTPSQRERGDRETDPAATTAGEVQPGRLPPLGGHLPQHDSASVSLNSEVQGSEQALPGTSDNVRYVRLGGRFFQGFRGARRWPALDP